MSENLNERTNLQGQRLARMATSDLHVYVYRDTTVSVTAVPAENRVVLGLGEYPAQLRVYLHALDLDRLHARIHDAFAQLDRPMTDAAAEAPEAWASGWDAALSWVQTSTSEPVPATTPGGAS